MAEEGLSAALERVGAKLLVRGWLSANNIVFAVAEEGATAIVDTGYFSHAEQTTQLLAAALGGCSLDHIVNTHLHSDHCGGNQALQTTHRSATLSVPAGYHRAVQPWDDSRLSFRETGQHCPPFRVDRYIAPGDTIQLGPCAWEVHSAAGHDPDAVMLYQPQQRILISGDALWERRLAIIFPELSGEAGFEQTHCTLDAIERLNPLWVLPGHGRAFSQVSEALRRSRERLELFAAQPRQHREHAARALAMFRMLEVRTATRQELQGWMVETPIFSRALGSEPNDLPTAADHRKTGAASNSTAAHAAPLPVAAVQVVDSLIRDGILLSRGNQLWLGTD